MKNLPRFIIPVLAIAFACICCTENYDSKVSDIQTYAQTIEQKGSINSFSIPSQYDLNLPRQISGINLPRLQNSSKRKTNASKNNFELKKNCKAYNGVTRIIVQKESLNIQNYHIKTVNRLTVLGMLII